MAQTQVCQINDLMVQIPYNDNNGTPKTMVQFNQFIRERIDLSSKWSFLINDFSNSFCDFSRRNRCFRSAIFEVLYGCDNKSMSQTQDGIANQRSQTQNLAQLCSLVVF